MANSLFRKKPLHDVLAQGDPLGDIHAPEGGHKLHRVLGVRDLTFFGIAAIIGAGSFTSMGEACFKGGPGVILLFIICAVACGFTALCYAEFASRVPTSGSAYTYAYVSFGELFAWIIGWALLMEYSIGNIYVAFSWSGYFNSLMSGFGVHIPDWLSINYKEAHRAFLANTNDAAMTAWQNAPVIGGLKIIFDLPAVCINVFITWLVYIGTKESRNATNAMVVIKLVILALVIIVGAFYVDVDNWQPFLPKGFGGVMAGASAVFFTYIGFDAVSTMAEECKDPKRDLPRGMIYSLAICTALYIILSLVIIGMTSYMNLHVNDPLAEVFKLHLKANEVSDPSHLLYATKILKWMQFIVSIAAVVAIASVLLVFQMGQPRIWMSMSRDGLMPKRFSKIHPKYKTPGFATIITGLVVGVPLFFTDKDFILDFTSIGTLFAFVLVCGGVLMLPRNHAAEADKLNKFRLPYINAKWIMPLLVIVTVVLLSIYAKKESVGFFTNEKQMYTASELISKLDSADKEHISVFLTSHAEVLDTVNVDNYISGMNEKGYSELVNAIPIDESKKFNSGFSLFLFRSPMWVFLAIYLIMVFYSFMRDLSLIPVLGLLSCLYLLTGMAPSNWIWFFVWMAIGLLVYFLYSRGHSKLNKTGG